MRGKRESPLPTEEEIKEVLGVNYLDDDDIEMFRIATAEALKWVVEWLQVVAEQHQVYTPVLLSEMLEAKLKEIENEQPREATVDSQDS